MAATTGKSTKSTMVVIIVLAVLGIAVGVGAYFMFGRRGQEAPGIITRRTDLYRNTPVVKDALYHAAMETSQEDLETGGSDSIVRIRINGNNSNYDSVKHNDSFCYPQLEGPRDPNKKLVVSGGDWKEEYRVLSREFFRGIVQRTVDNMDVCFEGMSFEGKEEEAAIAMIKTSSESGTPFVFSRLELLTLSNLSRGVTTEILWGCQFPSLVHLDVLGCDFHDFSFLENVAMDKLRGLTVIGAPSLTSIDIPVPTGVGLVKLVLIYLSYLSPTVKLDSLRKIIEDDILFSLRLDLYLVNQLCNGDHAIERRKEIYAFDISNMTYSGMEATINRLKTSNFNFLGFAVNEFRLGLFDSTHTDSEVKDIMFEWIEAFQIRQKKTSLLVTRKDKSLYLSYEISSELLTTSEMISPINITVFWAR